MKFELHNVDLHTAVEYIQIKSLRAKLISSYGNKIWNLRRRFSQLNWFPDRNNCFESEKVFEMMTKEFGVKLRFFQESKSLPIFSIIGQLRARKG